MFSFGIDYYQPSYSISFKLNDYHIFTNNEKQTDFLYINTISNKEYFANFLYIFNEDQLNINFSINNITLDAYLTKNEQDIYTVSKYESFNKKVNITYYHTKHSIFGLNYKSLFSDIVGSLRASGISDELTVQLGSPIINNINNIEIDQFIIFYKKDYKNYLFDFQLVNEYYDIYFQTLTPPFNPLIPIITFEKMNIKSRIAINLGISKNYNFNKIIVKFFIKQHIPIKNYYFNTINDTDNLEDGHYNQYGGGFFGLNIYFP